LTGVKFSEEISAMNEPLTSVARRSIFRVFVVPALASWLGKAQALPEVARLPVEQRDWILIWMQQLLVFLAERRVERPEAAHVQAYIVEREKVRTLPLPAQVQEAGRLLCALAADDPEAFARSIRASGKQVTVDDGYVRKESRAPSPDDSVAAAAEAPVRRGDNPEVCWSGCGRYFARSITRCGRRMRMCNG
jgi:hypothetical protein